MDDRNEHPADVTLPVVVWRNLAEDLYAIAEAIEAQLEAMGSSVSDDSYLTLRFEQEAIHAALELIARAQLGDDTFEALQADAAVQAEAAEDEEP